MTRADIGLKVCRNCGRELPLTDFYTQVTAKDGHRNVCKHCYIERKLQLRSKNPYHKVKHRTEMHEMKTCTECGRTLPETEFTDSTGSRCRECREKNREYQRRYREANREKVRAYSRDSNRRRRGGEEKRKSGPPKGCKFTKQDFTERPVPTKEPVKAGRLCQQCINWPCFAGIENLETDFAREGCHGWFPRSEVV